MHATARAFVAAVKGRFPWAFCNRDFTVLNVGALAVNWNNARFFENADNVFGVDVIAGPGVHHVGPIHEFESAVPYRTVICTSMLEHDKHWKDSIRRMADLTAPGGLLLISCAGPGYAEHMTKDHPVMVNGARVWLDHYRNISPDEIVEHVGIESFSVYSAAYHESNRDTFFWAVRH